MSQAASPEQTQSLYSDDSPSTTVEARSLVVLDGFEIYEEIGRGGMGVVYRAFDKALQREVALKVLQDRYAPDSPMAARFVTEAQITGRLQHPGIPAVYHVGLQPDGRPFLAMKLIRGRTLDHLIADRELLNRLALFESICQAVGYAHAHGIIHRDLKPANIMVGAFGEVQVMDWGLAKEIRATDMAVPTVDDDVTGPHVSNSELTLAGAVMGTPAYMPPEQAAGLIKTIDQRADVFGLGAILCVLLTDKPPYEGESALAVRQSAMQGETGAALARLKNSGAEPDLIQLATLCLSYAPSDRPADGNVVAHEVGRIRQSIETRAHNAALDRATRLVQDAEQRKRRRLRDLALAAIGLVLLAGVGASLWLAQQARAEAAAAEKARSEASQQREIAHDRLEKAVEAVEHMITRASSGPWATQAELQPERRAILEEAVAFFQTFDAEESQDPVVRHQMARAQLLVAGAYISLAEYEKCEHAARNAEEIYRQLVEAKPTDITARCGLAQTVGFYGHLGAIRARFDLAIQHYQQSEQLAKAACDADPNSVEAQLVFGESKASLASFFTYQDPARSLKFHNEIIEIVERLHQRGHRDFRSILLQFGATLQQAIADLNQQRVGPSIAKMMLAMTWQAELNRLSPPSARLADIFAMGKTTLLVQLGLAHYKAQQQTLGFPMIQQGLEQVTKLLVAQPKSFPLRIQKLQYQLIFADCLVKRSQFAEAEKLMIQLDADRAAILADTPTAGWLEGFGSVPRSMLLASLAAHGPCARLDREAEQLLRAGDYTNMGIIQYNVACAYSLQSQFATGEQREARIRRAFKLLFEAVQSGFFNNETRRNHLPKDTDLKPLHGRLEFDELLKKARTVMKPDA